MDVTLIGSDIHLGEHDPRAVNTFLALIAKMKPNKIALNGDIIDNTELHKSTRGLRQPIRQGRSSLQVGEELILAKLLLNAIRSAAPKAVITYIAGNHEARYPRTLANSCPEMFSTIPQLPELLELKQLGIDWIPDNESLQLPGLRVGHGDRCSQNAAMQEGLRGLTSYVQGHTHRLTLQAVTDPSTGVVRYFAQCGHMRDPRAGYTSQSKPNWQQGCLAWIEGLPCLIPYSHLDGTCNVGLLKVSPKETPAPQIWQMAARQIAKARKAEIDKAVKGTLWGK
jgi:predicted phosphodiesterase